MWISTASKPASRHTRAALTNCSVTCSMSARFIARWNRLPRRKPALLKPFIALIVAPLTRREVMKEPPWVIWYEMAPPSACTASARAFSSGRIPGRSQTWAWRVRPTSLTAP